jgi:hypothetical protein
MAPQRTTTGARVTKLTRAEQHSDDVVIQLIGRVAADPAVDVSKLERLLDLQERYQLRQAEIAFNAAMQATQAELPVVLRDAKNPQTNSTYARLETVSRAMSPVITKHGFSMSFGTDVSPLPDHYRVTCDLSHVAGFTRQYHADVPVDGAGIKGVANKTLTHALGSTLSYGRRYLKLMIFDVATTDDDDGSGASFRARLTDRQVEEIEGLIEEVVSQVGGNRDRYRRNFLAFMKVERIAAIAAVDFDRALAAINSTRRDR